MKAKIKKADIVKHWGLRLISIPDEDKDAYSEGGWLTDISGVIVAFACPRVANVQYDICKTIERYQNIEMEVQEIA